MAKRRSEYQDKSGFDADDATEEVKDESNQKAETPETVRVYKKHGPKICVDCSAGREPVMMQMQKTIGNVAYYKCPECGQSMSYERDYSEFMYGKYDQPINVAARDDMK